MATVDLNHVQFWQPPKPSLHQQHILPRNESRAASVTTSRNQPVTATRQRRRDFEAQPEDEVEAYGRIHDTSNYGDDADDTFPSIKKLLDPLLRKEITATECQGTRGWPMILEDDGDTPDHNADSEATPTSNAGPVPVFKLGQRADSSNREPWCDVEGDCFVYEDLHPLPSLDHKELAFTPAQDQPLPRFDSLEVSPGQTKPYGDDRTTRSASEESAPQSIMITLDEDGGKESEENFSDLERDMQLAFEEQEGLSSTSPSSPGRRSFEPSRPPIDEVCEGSWSAKLQSSTRLRSQKDMDGPHEQEQEMAADEIRHRVLEQEMQEAGDDDESEKLEQRGEKRQHQDEGIKNGINHSERDGHGHDTNDDNDEDNENPRPTKQRRLFPASPDLPPMSPFGQSLPTPWLAQPHSVTPSSTTRFDIGNTQSQTDLAHPPAAVNNEHYYTPPSSRSPLDTELASAADYQEWPLQGFLKRVTIDSQITYNLEFSLSHMPKQLSLSPHSEVLSTSSRESSVESVVSRRAVTSRKPGKELTKNQEIRLAKMVHDDKTWAEIGGHFPGHTLQSLKDNFFTKQGGKPRKRGRKPGVRVVGV